MAILAERHINLIRLILRSEDEGDGWRQMSDLLWPHFKDVLPPELCELDVDNKRIRLTPEGVSVSRWLV